MSDHDAVHDLAGVAKVLKALAKPVAHSFGSHRCSEHSEGGCEHPHLQFSAAPW